MEKLLPSTSSDAAIKIVIAAPSSVAAIKKEELHPSTSFDAAIERSATAAEIDELVPSIPSIPSVPSTAADDKIEEVTFGNLPSSSSSGSILRNSILIFFCWGVVLLHAL